MNNNTVKSSIAAGLLGVFLGAFGAHDWYLGNTKKGLIHVCLFAGGFILTVISLSLLALTSSIPIVPNFFAFLAIISYLVLAGNTIWGFVEGIIIIAQGDAGLAAQGYTVAAPVQAAPQAPQTTTVTPAPAPQTPVQTAPTPAQATPEVTTVATPETTPAASAPAATETQTATPSETQPTATEKTETKASTKEEPKQAETKTKTPSETKSESKSEPKDKDTKKSSKKTSEKSA